METLSALLALSTLWVEKFFHIAGPFLGQYAQSLVDSPHKGPAMHSFDGFFCCINDHTII